MAEWNFVPVSSRKIFLPVYSILSAAVSLDFGYIRILPRNSSRGFKWNKLMTHKILRGENNHDKL